MPIKGVPGAWKPTKALAPLTSATPSAPTGEIERWLVAHREDYGVLCVVWDHYGFGARERAESFTHISRDRLLLVRVPLWPEEKTLEHPWNALQLADRLGFWMHVEPSVLDAVFPAAADNVVTDVDHVNGVITAQAVRPSSASDDEATERQA